MRLSEHFSSEEFTCRCQRGPACNAPTLPTQALVEGLERLRVAHGHAIHITSGIRCEPWNRFVGGVQGSEHLTGEGADILADTAQARYTLLSLILTQHLFRRVGVAARFLHVGVSSAHPQDVCWVYPARD